MAERLITRPSPSAKDTLTRYIQEATEVPLYNGQNFLVRENPLLLPSESSEALMSLPYLNETEEKYPYYVNHEGFITGPRQLGQHAWLVGGQEFKKDFIPVNANTLLVGNMLIDPGSREGIPYLLENLLSLGKKLDDIELVLLTHAHLDHAEAINDLQMIGLIADVLIPQKSVEQVTQVDVRKIGMDMYDHDFNPFAFHGTLSHGDTIFSSGYAIKAHEFPGHSEDSMYFEITDKKGHTPFAVADLLFGGSRKEFGSDNTVWRESLIEFMPQVRAEDDIITGHNTSVIHKSPGLEDAVRRFGQQRASLVPGESDLIDTYWAA